MVFIMARPIVEGAINVAPICLSVCLSELSCACPNSRREGNKQLKFGAQVGELVLPFWVQEVKCWGH